MQSDRQPLWALHMSFPQTVFELPEKEAFMCFHVLSCAFQVSPERLLAWRVQESDTSWYTSWCTSGFPSKTSWLHGRCPGAWNEKRPPEAPSETPGEGNLQRHPMKEVNKCQQMSTQCPNLSHLIPSLVKTCQNHPPWTYDIASFYMCFDKNFSAGALLNYTLSLGLGGVCTRQWKHRWTLHRSTPPSHWLLKATSNRTLTQQSFDPVLARFFIATNNSEEICCESSPRSAAPCWQHCTWIGTSRQWSRWGRRFSGREQLGTLHSSGNVVAPKISPSEYNGHCSDFMGFSSDSMGFKLHKS